MCILIGNEYDYDKHYEDNSWAHFPCQILLSFFSCKSSSIPVELRSWKLCPTFLVVIYQILIQLWLLLGVDVELLLLIYILILVRLLLMSIVFWLVVHVSVVGIGVNTTSLGKGAVVFIWLIVVISCSIWLISDFRFISIYLASYSYSCSSPLIPLWPPSYSKSEFPSLDGPFILIGTFCYRSYSCFFWAICFLSDATSTSLYMRISLSSLDSWIRMIDSRRYRLR